MQAYDWPGNVRELQHAVERAVILSSEPIDSAARVRRPAVWTERRMERTDAGANVRRLSARAAETERRRWRCRMARSCSTSLNVDEAEAKLIERALEVSSGNRTKAAELLGISVRTLRNKLNGAKIADDGGGGE